MPISWPSNTATFPQQFLSGSVSGGPDNNVRRTQTDGGKIRQEKINENPTETYHGDLVFETEDDYETFITFWKQNCAREFEWTHPHIPTQAATCRFVGPPVDHPSTTWFHRVSIAVEVVP